MVKMNSGKHDFLKLSWNLKKIKVKLWCNDAKLYNLGPDAIQLYLMLMGSENVKECITYAWKKGDV